MYVIVAPDGDGGDLLVLFCGVLNGGKIRQEISSD
jgi:hypothetical protein